MKIPKVTMNDYIKSENNPFYESTSSIVSECPDFLKNDNFQKVLTGVIDNLYGCYKLRTKYELTLNAIIKSDVMYLYAMNAYKYQKLFDTLSIEYNPIENYRMVEDGTDDRDITKGSQSDRQEIGQRSDSMTTGSRSDVSTHKVSPSETTNFINKEQDSYDYGSHTDNTNIGAQTNQYISGNREDRDNLKHHLTRSGNIGVTTSQQMIESERQLADFSLYRLIAKDIMQLLCSGMLS